MIGFMFLSILLLIIVLWLITPALLGKRTINQDDTDSQNTEIARERLADLELRLENDDVSQNEFEQTKIEIEKSLLQDVRDGETKVHVSPKNERNAFVLVTAIPLLAFGLYWLWGSPDSINLKGNATSVSQHSSQSGNRGQSINGKPNIGSVDEMAVLLEKKLEQTPNNPNGWYTLGRTYMSLKKYDQAIVALRRLRQLVPNDATVLVTLADAITMARKGRMQGEPFELVKQALTIKPDEPTALWLAGLGYAETGDGKSAIKSWKQLLPLVSKDPQSVRQVQTLIVAAERKMGLTPTIKITQQAPVAATIKNQTTSSRDSRNDGSIASISVTVKLSEKVKATTSPADFVLIYARAAKGPRMPLAIVRKQVKDLPITVILDDSMAMRPTMKLSNFAEVNIVARVSKSGQAISRSGDIQGLIGPVSVSEAKSVSVVIDKVLP